MKELEIKIGQSFWALIDGELIILSKEKGDDEYSVLGLWEGSLHWHQFKVIELIKIPKGYEKNKLYYQ